MAKGYQEAAVIVLFAKVERLRPSEVQSIFTLLLTCTSGQYWGPIFREKGLLFSPTLAMVVALLLPIFKTQGQPA